MPFLAFTASRAQIATYLLGIALFSISFLVFLNSELSFVITERIGQRDNVGDAVGTLGFADELVALVACPVWGILSDRVGVAKVAVAGYAIVGLSLFVFVQAKNVYPQLLLARLFFSLGASATTTMVTAILPTMTHVLPPQDDIRTPGRGMSGHGHTVSVSPSISSELTITPARYRSNSPPAHTRTRNSPAATTSRLAGLVGMFTGLGALLALGVFLPLPARFQQNGVIASEAVAYSFYIVGTVALAVAIACIFGLRDLPGETSKGWHKLCGPKEHKSNEGNGAAIAETQTNLSYPRLLVNAMALGFGDVNVGLGYLGGFVARASSVAISLFIPLFTNAYFISSGLCEPGDNGSEDMKTACRRAYVLAAILTGTSQLVALLCAPLFGYLSGRYRKYNQPLILSTVAGIAGYVAFGLLKSPDPRSKDGSTGIFFIAALLGISQIGAIVCSLGLLSRGINGEAADAINDDGEDEDEHGEDGLHPHQRSTNAPRRRPHLDDTPAQSPSLASSGLRDPLANPDPDLQQQQRHQHDAENSPLLPAHFRRLPGATASTASRTHLKGSIAGVYSLAGGAGILLLTKVGGVMFDRLDYGAPFFLMAGFNAVLLLAAVGCSFSTLVRGRRRSFVLP